MLPYTQKNTQKKSDEQSKPLSRADDRPPDLLDSDLVLAFKVGVSQQLDGGGCAMMWQTPETQKRGHDPL